MMRQRVLGVVVLVSVGVVLWTVLFTGSAQYALDRSTRIPEEPQVPRPERRQLTVIPDVPSTEGKSSDQSATAVNTVSNPKPKLDEENGLPEAWVVLVATFSKRGNAESLKESLQEARYMAYVQRLPGEQGDFFRVMVGPKFSRNYAERVKLAIEKQYKLEAMLMRFEH